MKGSVAALIALGSAAFNALDASLREGAAREALKAVRELRNELEACDKSACACECKEVNSWPELGAAGGVFYLVVSVTL